MCNRYKEAIMTLADRLEVLQVSKNDGRGVECIRCLIFLLRRGEDIKLSVEHDWDKIRNYPDIANLLKEEGLAQKHWYVS
jgi:hypothetical protein